MSYPQETKEFQPIRVRVDGVEVVTGVKVAVIAPNTRPITWVDPVLIEPNRLAVMVDGLEPGNWNVWAQVTTEDEVAVVYCGTFKVTA